MKIITTYRGILVCNLFMFGLTACSSEPAPWTRPDDSPWSEQQAAPTAQEAVVEEPAVVTEPKPYMEPVMIDEPEPVVAAVAVPEPEPVALSAEEQILAMDSGYAVQIYASSTMSGVDAFKADHGLYDLLAVKTDRDGAFIYVLVSPQPDRSSATEVAAELEQRTGTKPWVRAIQGLQKVVVQ